MAYISLDSDQIKKAHKKHKYTTEQVLKLEKCMDLKTGPLFFMKEFIKIIESIGFNYGLDNIMYNTLIGNAVCYYTYNNDIL